MDGFFKFFVLFCAIIVLDNLQYF